MNYLSQEGLVNLISMNKKTSYPKLAVSIRWMWNRTPQLVNFLKRLKKTTPVRKLISLFMRLVLHLAHVLTGQYCLLKTATSTPP